MDIEENNLLNDFNPAEALTAKIKEEEQKTPNRKRSLLSLTNIRISSMRISNNLTKPI